MLTAVSVAQESGFISKGTQILLVSVVEASGSTKIEFHSSGGGSNSKDVGGDRQLLEKFRMNGVSEVREQLWLGG